MAKAPTTPAGLIRAPFPFKRDHMVFSLFDAHWPETDPATISCMFQAMDYYRKWLKGFVIGGDGVDNKMISPHTKGKPQQRQDSYINQCQKFSANILRPVERLIPRDGFTTYILGNHEDWMVQYIEENPEWEGSEIQDLLELNKRGWIVVPCGVIWKYGKMHWFHGEWLTGGQHAKKAVDTICGNCCYGHFHTIQSFTKVLAHNHHEKWHAICMPIGGRVNPQWVRNAPNGWVNGFGVTCYRADGSFNHFPVVVTQGRCSVLGKTFKG